MYSIILYRCPNLFTFIPFVYRNTIQKVKGELQTIMSLLTTGTHRCGHQMAMFPYTDITQTQASPATATIITAVTWEMTEDIQLRGILTCRKVLKRREIETSNPLEISMQVMILYCFLIYSTFWYNFTLIKIANFVYISTLQC